MTTRIAIVGGGIAGLTLATLLDRQRFEVSVHEAQPERATTGSALGLWGPARRVLRRIGALPDGGAQPAEGALHRIDGRRVVTARGAGPVMVDRPTLLAALDAAVPTSVHRVSEEVTDPASLDADLVIGADGVRSQVRGLVVPHAAARVATPYLALRGIRSGTVPPGDAGEYWGRGLLAGLVPIGGGRTYWFTSHRSELSEPLDLAVVLAEARDRFADAAPAIRRMLDGAGPDTLATSLWVAPPLRSYARGRYIVVGDAAHAMLPNLGRGACSAVVDAATLAGTLNTGGDLRRWQARRIPATQVARVGSAALMRIALAIP
ncbi:FAD-dependent monooxygenase [Flexivirga oryzae]|uniref:2-polyprenyl-6-methoxyphenol hydroxylase-like FAD-dependent oxidoreductase n=1 Tax=Flexivirga oryzae TaxID=1794944 RepID=A0A839NAU6_9MICO|nr:FAD-dependent monooxygenase [Flexivirga oryzae]MBB2893959.1 2-polyprenyl-6-methoxyphenol hydroxylase-like FAD-dependent oxidoreductase [Flexivirga oryzae]